MFNKKNSITKKIKEKYGTVKHFCKLKGYNYGTFRTVLAGCAKSKRVENLLKEEGFLDEKVS